MFNVKLNSCGYLTYMYTQTFLGHVYTKLTAVSRYAVDIISPVIDNFPYLDQGYI